LTPSTTRNLFSGISLKANQIAFTVTIPVTVTFTKAERKAAYWISIISSDLKLWLRLQVPITFQPRTKWLASDDDQHNWNCYQSNCIHRLNWTISKSTDVASGNQIKSMQNCEHLCRFAQLSSDLWMHVKQGRSLMGHDQRTTRIAGLASYYFLCSFMCSNFPVAWMFGNMVHCSII
jgi:hypothetical protein